jgi:hypothetical protein
MASVKLAAARPSHAVKQSVTLRDFAPGTFDGTLVARSKREVLQGVGTMSLSRDVLVANAQRLVDRAEQRIGLFKIHLRNRQTQGLECERLSARVGRMELELKRLQLYRAVMCTTHLPEAVMPEAVAAARLRT